MKQKSLGNKRKFPSKSGANPTQKALLLLIPFVAWGILLFQRAAKNIQHCHLYQLSVKELIQNKIRFSPSQKISISKFQKGASKKISYERRDYESVDDGSLS